MAVLHRCYQEFGENEHTISEYDIEEGNQRFLHSPTFIAQTITTYMENASREDEIDQISCNISEISSELMQK